ncbi:hypothetical protein A3A71_01665 [Candidatus Berkelbacteria bacterium RIFCSPLOWO2_01_FULL_50_28]|uniref:Uncharacterized protein n=1 Tax=Candidatus Berkelbacteria bacterium RIFCSPLOWO2_01_FULL_50_28 TaxID=1797471 RepID=A0A1F5EBS1_9BACT|nr:MAG: hypothetical protein A3F39_01505 [Candidatus Berkelbacteria bacterium RIFCSPHIGHO2_12_FULL_50_11]OGD64740.1 MAG: hypothetical protein A3A71_01665 [Candidatus Berkelbacteria bacterium RIFCSPLOWO2_01_FULL_50_28]
MGIEESQGLSPEEAQSAEAFVSPVTGGELSKERVIADALKAAAETTPESILRGPEKMAADWRIEIGRLQAAFDRTSELLARPDLDEAARIAFGKDLKHDREQLEFTQGKYDEFLQRHPELT